MCQRPTAPRVIAADRGEVVVTFTGLVRAVAGLAYQCFERHLVYRGQIEDHRTQGENGRSTLKPTLYRHRTWRRSLEKLLDITPELQEEFHGEAPHARAVRLYVEAIWAIIQHYQLANTPLLDVTRSLHVAATFATERPENGGDRFVYVLGTRYPSDQLSYSTVDRTVLAILQPLLPSDASRPLFQEGLLLGQWPLNLRKGARAPDFNRLLVGKFRIPENALGRFWDGAHQALPMESLMPEPDPMQSRLVALQARLKAAGLGL